MRYFFIATTPRVAQHHPLVEQGEVSVYDLRHHRFVAIRAGYLMHRFAQGLLGAELPPDWHSTHGAEMGKVMVADGLGVTVLPHYSVPGIR
ncbi:MAG TPA: LysR substrate-binding domain-containing protein [Actinomycetales bacterium]|nr:LysR substrate-binding domain-containing protein [Actinomycetales bacterium]